MNKKIISTRLISLLLCFSMHSYANAEIQSIDGELSDTYLYATTPSDSIYLFEYDNDTIRQVVQFLFLDDSKIKFKLTSENIIRNKTVVKQGVAKNRYKNFASETDEDENGNLYPVKEYIYEKECWLAFRFDAKYTRLIIKEADNKDALPCCPLKSIEVLRPNCNKKN